MKKHIYEDSPENPFGKYIGSVDAVPECGEDFCDTCGDCLSCYGGDECLSNEDGKHFWVEYRDVSPA